jgi:hypothetical protein
MSSCEVCKDMIRCTCESEGDVEARYRSCTKREEYPKSMSTLGCRTVHLCSKECGRKYSGVVITDATRCRVCHTDGRKKLCAGCNVARYCSKECQHQDWPTHKTECKYLTGKADITEKAPLQDSHYLEAAQYFREAYQRELKSDLMGTGDTYTREAQVQRYAEQLNFWERHTPSSLDLPLNVAKRMKASQMRIAIIKELEGWGLDQAVFARAAALREGGQ